MTLVKSEFYVSTATKPVKNLAQWDTFIQLMTSELIFVTHAIKLRSCVALKYHMNKEWKYGDSTSRDVGGVLRHMIALLHLFVHLFCSLSVLQASSAECFQCSELRLCEKVGMGWLEELLLEQRALVGFPNPLALPKVSEAGNYTYIHVPVEMIVSLGLSTFIDIFFNWVFIENRLTEVMLKAYFLVLTLLSWAAFWRDLRSHEKPTIWAYSWKLVCAPSAFSPAVRQSWIARCFALERPGEGGS